MSICSFDSLVLAVKSIFCWHPLQNSMVDLLQQSCSFAVHNAKIEIPLPY